MVLFPGPPNAFDNRPVVLLSVGSTRSLLVMNVVEPSRSMREVGLAATLARILVRRRPLGRSWLSGTALIWRSSSSESTANDGILV